MRIIRGEDQHSPYSLEGLTLGQVTTIRHALERYNTPVATDVYLAIRQELQALGELGEERPPHAAEPKKEAGKSGSIPLIICRRQ